MRGGAPGTRETDALEPTCLVERVDAVCLAGGSAFGLGRLGAYRYHTKLGMIGRDLLAVAQLPVEAGVQSVA